MSVYDVDGNILSTIYAIDGAAITRAYDINGEIVFGGEVDYDAYVKESTFNLSVLNCQGIELYNDVLFQFRASGSSVVDTVCLFDYATKSDINRNMGIKSDHGDSASFSKEFYAVGDEFPLLYVTADTTPAKIYVDRVTRSGATLIKTLVFPQSAGYYGAGAFDFDNDICYLLSYKQNSYASDNDGANTTVVTVWDLSNLTDNGDGTHTPAYIRQFERPFIYVMQGLAYKDGMIWVASGYGGRQSYIYAISATDGELMHTIDLNTTTEVEGMTFISDTKMLVGFQGGRYEIYTFGTS